MAQFILVGHDAKPLYLNLERVCYIRKLSDASQEVFLDNGASITLDISDFDIGNKLKLVGAMVHESTAKAA